MPEMPPLERGGYLVNYLLEIGPTVAAGMGAGPITFGELDAWCNRTGIDLQPWEARCICRLSREYLGELHKATARDAKAPWLPAEAKPEVTSEQAAWRALANL